MLFHFPAQSYESDISNCSPDTHVSRAFQRTATPPTKVYNPYTPAPDQLRRINTQPTLVEPNEYQQDFAEDTAHTFQDYPVEISRNINLPITQVVVCEKPYDDFNTAFRAYSAALDHPHIIIGKTGMVYEFLGYEYSAEYPEEVCWGHSDDICQTSVRIDLLYEYGDTFYTPEQLESLNIVVTDLMRLYNIHPTQLLHYTDIHTPAITQRMFPWEFLHTQHELGAFVTKQDESHITVPNISPSHPNFKTRYAKLLQKLGYPIGKEIDTPYGTYTYSVEHADKAFRLHHSRNIATTLTNLNENYDDGDELDITDHMDTILEEEPTFHDYATAYRLCYKYGLLTRRRAAEPTN